MMGTFATLLAKSKIATPAERYRAQVRGDIENVGGVLKITRIDVAYALKLAPEKRPEAQACFDLYLPHCPAAQSVIGCIAIDHRLVMHDL
jgi:hypothetical protein